MTGGDIQAAKALVRAGVVGAGGVEPPSSSVSDPRAATVLYGGRVETGKDHLKAAGEHRCQCPNPPTIRHGSPTAMLVRTAIGCCPSAAPETPTLTFGTHNLISSGSLVSGGPCSGCAAGAIRGCVSLVRRPSRRLGLQDLPGAHEGAPRSSVPRQSKPNVGSHLSTTSWEVHLDRALDLQLVGGIARASSMSS